jgi:pyruvate dehydrogenase E2 component (dihydrolipoamide acetyltransferase)
MIEFAMPSLGADMEAGTLVEWLKRPGEAVHRGDIIAVVETDKGAIEIEIFEEGTLDRLLVEPGRKVPVGTPLARVLGSGEAAPPVAPAPPIAAPASPLPAVAPRAGPAPPGIAGIRASPAARRLAAERGVALDGLAGSGPGGAIVRADVERALAGSTPRAPRKLDLAGMRRAIAAAMARSKREIPHYYLTATIDASALLAWVERVNQERPPEQRLLPQVPLLKAVALALRRRPGFNGFYENDQFVSSEAIHLGTAIAIRGGGLIAPAIHDVDRLDPWALMERLRDLVARARSGTLRSSELTDATATVSSLGERGAESLLGIIYPPQVALIGFGAPLTRPWAVGDRIEARPLIGASLAADHRVTDGHLGSLLLAEIAHLLQEPDKL